jgi:hypothetical protein
MDDVDACIVCLDPLQVATGIHDDLQDAGALREVAESVATPHPSSIDSHQQIALIKPCNHVLHDECLREWSQKANSCPICRQTFNLVQVLNKFPNGKLPPSFYFQVWSVANSANCSQLCGLIFSSSELNNQFVRVGRTTSLGSLAYGLR